MTSIRPSDPGDRDLSGTLHRSSEECPVRADGIGEQAAGARKLRVGFILLDQFTLAGFAGFVEALRLAADDGGRSRQIYASWSIMTEKGLPCRASCGAVIGDPDDLKDPHGFDYIAVCGGNGNLSTKTQSPALLDYLRAARAANVCLIGVCNGTFTIARAGLIGARTVCINWNSLDAFRAKFPAVRTRTDHLFIDEGDLITCAGSTAAIDLGTYLISRHCGEHRARQVVRHMLLQQMRPARLPQPHFFSELLETDDVRVRQAVHLMEQRLDSPPSIDALARYVGVSDRQLGRLFRKATGLSTKTFLLHLRLRYARWLLLNSSYSVMQIAFNCGFADASHFSREFRALFFETPRNVRKYSAEKSTH